jgi:hypothetical protein
VNPMKYLRAMVVIMLAMLMFAVSSWAANAADDANPPLPSPVGRVVWVKGTLKAVMQNSEERILQKTSVIYEKDTLITDGASQAQIVFTDNTLMTFREGSKFYIKEYNFNPNSGQKSVGKYIMNLIEGGFRTITGYIAKSNPSDYQVNTPVATIGVRGTDYAVYLKAGELFIGYYTGEPCVKSGTTNQEKELCLSAEQQYGYVPRENAIPVPIMQRPDGFRERLEIVPAHITPFSATQPTNIQPAITPRGNGPVSSFCITQ